MADTPAGVLTRSTVQKVVETGFLSATWLALGLYLELVGPTQKDLIITTNSNYEDVAFATSGRALGLFPGCIIGGFLVDKFSHYCHLILAFSLDIAAIVTVIIPWMSHANAVFVLCFIGGAVESSINVAGQRRILDIWLEKSASPMIFLHLGYGIGSFIVPLYTNPFLAVLDTSTNCTTGNGSALTTTEPTDCLEATKPDGPKSYTKETRLQYPYAISACLVALLSVVFFVYQILENRRANRIKGETTQTTEKRADEGKPRSLLQLINPATCTGGRLVYGLQLFILLFFYLGNIGGGERCVAGFVRSFSIDQLGFSKDDGSYINTTFWVSFTGGRFLFFILARWISIRILVIVEGSGLLITAILMNIFAKTHVIAYWVLVQPLGLFVAPLWPSGVAWADFHVELTGIGMAVLLLGGSAGGFAHLRIIGYLYENIGHVTFLYQVLGYAILTFVLAVTLDLVGAQHGNRFKTETASDNIEDPDTISADTGIAYIQSKDVDMASMPSVNPDISYMPSREHSSSVRL